MNVLSLFDGMSCGKIAFDMLDLPVDTYYASEIEPNAIEVSNNNYPDIIRMGDVSNWHLWDLDWSTIDLIIGGSPCQGFSFAGQQKAFEDPRSVLFYTFVEILEHTRFFNPDVKFLLENVHMKKEHLAHITDILEIEPIKINSKVLSAQNRNRWYWFNWDNAPITDMSHTLIDIVEDDVDKFSSDELNRREWQQKIHQYFDPIERFGVFSEDHQTERFFKKREGTLAYKKAISQMRTVNDVANCLTTSGQSISNSGSTNLLHYKWDGRLAIRPLTPVECERCQVVPDNYTKAVSASQRCKMLGNGWTVSVIARLLQTLPHPKNKCEDFSFLDI